MVSEISTKYEMQDENIKHIIRIKNAIADNRERDIHVQESFLLFNRLLQFHIIILLILDRQYRHLANAGASDSVVFVGITDAIFNLISARQSAGLSCFHAGIVSKRPHVRGCRFIIIYAPAPIGSVCPSVCPTAVPKSRMEGGMTV